MTDFPLTFHILKLVKALLFDIPEDGKRYPFRGESPRNPALYRLLYVGRNPLPQGNPDSKVYYKLNNSRVTLANKPVHHYHYHYLFFTFIFWGKRTNSSRVLTAGDFFFSPSTSIPDKMRDYSRCLLLSQKQTNKQTNTQTKSKNL